MNGIPRLRRSVTTTSPYEQTLFGSKTDWRVSLAFSRFAMLPLGAVLVLPIVSGVLLLVLPSKCGHSYKASQTL